MKFAICNETFDGWSHPDALACAASLGYTGIEVAPFTLDADVRRISAAQRAEFRNLARTKGLTIAGLHWLLARTEGLHLTSGDPEVRVRTADYLVELIRFCADLGGTVMVFGSPKQRDLQPGVTFEEGATRAAEVFSRVMAAAESAGVTIALEPLARTETNFINTASQGMEIIRRVGHPRFRLHLDVKAMSDEGRPVEGIIREFGKHAAHFHANDPNARGPGTSGLDHAPFAAALREIGYDGWVSVEVFHYKPDPRAIAADAMTYLKRVYAG